MLEHYQKLASDTVTDLETTTQALTEATVTGGDNTKAKLAQIESRALKLRKSLRLRRSKKLARDCKNHPNTEGGNKAAFPPTETAATTDPSTQPQPARNNQDHPMTMKKKHRQLWKPYGRRSRTNPSHTQPLHRHLPATVTQQPNRKLPQTMSLRLPPHFPHRYQAHRRGTTTLQAASPSDVPTTATTSHTTSPSDVSPNATNPHTTNSTHVCPFSPPLLHPIPL